MTVDDEHAETIEILMAGWRKRQFVGDPFGRLVWTGENIELQGEIGGAARHRSGNRQPAAYRHIWHMRRPGSVHRHKIKGRLVGEDAAKMRRAAQGSANIRAEFERYKAGSEGRRRPAGRSPWCAP